MVKKFSVVLDTNFIVDLFKFRLGLNDVEDEFGRSCDFLVAKQSLDELDEIDDKYSKLGVKLINSDRVSIVEVSGSTVDDAIVKILSAAKKSDRIKEYAVGTNDSKLRAKLKNMGAKIIYLRARKQLEVRN